MKKILCVLTALGAAVLMAVGVHAADKYSVGTVSAYNNSGTFVPINVEADSDGTQVNGYIIKLTYDSTKVSPVKLGTDDLSKECYARAGTGFEVENSVLVSDVISEDGNQATLVVAWAGATPVDISANTKQTMAEVEFVKANTQNEAVTEEVPIKVELAALTNDGDSTVDVENSQQVEVADGEIVVGKYGDIDSSGAVDSYDASLALEHVAKHQELLTPQQIKIGDVSGDTVVDSYDASLILEYVAKRGDLTFPVEQK